jgi:hypothetical protein
MESFAVKFILLDDFPLWTTYLLGLIVLCGFLFALAMLLRSWKTPKRDARGAWIGRHLWFLTIVGALAVWFLGSSMYFCFHGIRIDAQHFALFYFWPRPDVILGIDDPIAVELLPARRTCGLLSSRRRKRLFAASISKSAKMRSRCLLS